VKKLFIASAFLIAFAVPASAQSFNCHYARTPDEVMICQDAHLSALDEQMSSMFYKLRNSLPSGQVRFLESDQASWLSNRMACGRDAGCIEEAYERRIRQLRAQDFTQNEEAPPAPPSPFQTTCFAFSPEDGYVNVRETPNGILIGPVPEGTPIRVLDTWFDPASNINWSRIQTPFLARVDRTGVVATYLVRCKP
jgi:uncharacterized protein